MIIHRNLPSSRLLLYRIGNSGIDQLADRPDMVCNPHRHSRRDPQGFMDVLRGKQDEGARQSGDRRDPAKGRVGWRSRPAG
jgi:hypothetical protein